MTAPEQGPSGPHTESRAASPAPPLRALARGVDQSAVYSMELLAGILTWMGLGWLADQWLGTEPWVMVAGALIGYAAGLYLIWLRSRDAMQTDDATRGQASEPALAQEQPGRKAASVGPADVGGRARGETPGV